MTNIRMTKLTWQKLPRLFLIVLFVSINTWAFSQVSLEYEKKLTMKSLRFWYSNSSRPSHIFNRNISPKSDCIQVANGYLFFTWFKGGMSERNLMLSRMNLATKEWVTIQFPDKNTLYSGDYRGTDMTGAGDSHRTTTVGVSPIDGTVHLAYDMHTGPLQYRVSNRNIAFGPDSEFKLSNFSSKRDYFKPGSRIPSFTYPNFEVNNAGELIVEYRLGTARQGDKYITYYNGNTWSDVILLIKGNNENPQFNQYGGLTYYFGKMYLGCSIRQYGSSIPYNQGFYFAEAGQRGNENWKNLAGRSFSLPIRGLNQMNNFKICEPLPAGSDGKTSAPSLVVSQHGAVHMTNRVPGTGTVHYYTNVGSKTLRRASGTTPAVSFAGNDGRVYSVNITGGNIKVASTPEGQSNWRTDYTYNISPSLGIMRAEYHDGKIYIIVAESVNSDKQPLHLVILKLNNGSTTGGPAGYTYACNENQTVNVSGTMNIAYGANGQFNYLYNQTSNKPCNNATFGDPIPGVVKKCYVKSVSTNQSPTVSFATPGGNPTVQTGYSLYVKVNASDADGTISNVKLYINNNLVRQENHAPYEWGHATSPNPNECNGLAAGTHTFRAVATDNSGNTGQKSFTLTVQNPVTTKIVHMAKRNSSNYSIDGGNGGANNQNVYLWSTNINNVNQQWEEINRGGGFYSYKKNTTNYCLDGGNGGSNGQNVKLYTCQANNQNQHWKKIDAGSGHYRLQKRNASGYSIDGGNGGANGQNLYLWTSRSTNQNQQWKFTNNNEAKDADAMLTKADRILVYPNPARSSFTIALNGIERAEISIFDAVGSLVYQSSTENSLEISTAGIFGKGLYTIRIVDNNQESSIQRLLIK